MTETLYQGVRVEDYAAELAARHEQALTQYQVLTQYPDGKTKQQLIWAREKWIRQNLKERK